MAYFFPSQWRILIKAHFNVQTLTKLSFNFTCVNSKKRLHVQCWKQYENSDIMSNEDTWYNSDIRIDNNTV